MSEKKLCLVVDDSDLIREIAARIVADLGFETAQAANAADAIATCEAEGPVAVLLDWDLPAMGALDFLRGAAELNCEPKPQIILCATENDPQQFTLAKAAGAAFHVLKPYDRDTIAAALVEAGVLDGSAIEGGAARENAKG